MTQQQQQQTTRADNAGEAQGDGIARPVTVRQDRSPEAQQQASESREARSMRRLALDDTRGTAQTVENATVTALRAARSAMRGYTGAQDAEDVAQEALCRLLAAAGPAARAWAAFGSPMTLGAFSRGALQATVRNVAREAMAGRTAAEREAPLALSFDVPTAYVDDGAAMLSLGDIVATYGTVGLNAQQRSRSDMTEASILLGVLRDASAGEASAQDGGVRLSDGSTATLPGGYRCAADAVGLVVTFPDGETAADPWAHVRALTLTSAASERDGSTRYGTQATAAASKYAQQDRAILAAVEAFGNMRDAAAALAITVAAGRSRLRAARLRAAGETVNRKGTSGRGAAAAA